MSKGQLNLTQIPADTSCTCTINIKIQPHKSIPKVYTYTHIYTRVYIYTNPTLKSVSPIPTLVRPRNRNRVCTLRSRVNHHTGYHTGVHRDSASMMDAPRQPGRVKNISFPRLEAIGNSSSTTPSLWILDASLIVGNAAGKVSRPIKGEHRFNRGSGWGSSRGCRGGERHKSRPSWFQFLERSERLDRDSLLSFACHPRWPIYLFARFARFYAFPRCMYTCTRTLFHRFLPIDRSFIHI